jgi:hypothetical protein
MRIFIAVAILALYSSCSKDKIWKDDDLSIQRADYNGTELKTNGYYFNKWGDPEINSIYFFYSNGVLLKGGSPYVNDISQREQDFKNGVYYEFAKKTKYLWGVFIIDSNVVKFEKWYPSEPPYWSYVNEGLILNDTTFVIKSKYRMKDGKKTEYSELDEVYYFKPFPNKPDSTNSFVK